MNAKAAKRLRRLARTRSQALPAVAYTEAGRTRALDAASTRGLYQNFKRTVGKP